METMQPMQRQARDSGGRTGIPTLGPGDVTILGGDYNVDLISVPPPAPVPAAPRPAPVQTQDELATLDDIFIRHNPLAIPKRGGTPVAMDDAILRAVLSRVAPDDAKRLAEQARVQVDALGSQIEGEYRNAQTTRNAVGDLMPSRDWPARVFPLVERRAHLRAAQAFLVALASGKPGRFSGPTRGDIEAEFAGLVVELHLKTSAVARFSEIQAAATRRRDRLAVLAASADAARAAPFAPSMSDFEAVLATAARLEIEASDLAAELAEASKALSAIGPALASAITSAVEAAGVKEAISGLVECRLVDPSRRDTVPPEADELARIEGTLSAMGASPTSPAPGKIVGGLQSRHRELTEAITRRREADRKAIEAEATHTVQAALRGDVRAFAELTRAVQDQPAAFNDGLGADLDAVPLKAIGAVGSRSFAGAIGFWL